MTTEQVTHDMSEIVKRLTAERDALREAVRKRDEVIETLVTMETVMGLADNKCVCQFCIIERRKWIKEKLK